MPEADPDIAGVDTQCWTNREIWQQPSTLCETQALVDCARDELDRFLYPLLAQTDLRVILSGAGTSAFIGDSLAPTLSRDLGRCVEAIATTDIVSAPSLYLHRSKPTLLVSFGRSGNSPESKAAIELADEMIDDVHHLVITCNAQGALAHLQAKNVKSFVLPDATHDRSFAMTSSFTGMMLAALRIFTGAAHGATKTVSIAASIDALLDTSDTVAEKLVWRNFDRVVYLGSGCLTGLAREAALKLMELSDGAIVTCFDSAMGLRHGPKTFLTERTLAVIFVSNDPLTACYDRDIIAELVADGRTGHVIAVSTQTEECDTIRVNGMEGVSDSELALAFIVPAQVLAYRWSLALRLDPDNPNRNGTVNRVVKGVEIHHPAAK